MSNPIVYVLSDSVGETAELVLKAALSQFSDQPIHIVRKSFLISEQQLAAALDAVEAERAAVIYTLVRPELIRYLETRLNASGILHVDLMGPVIEVLKKLTHAAPRNEPGLIRKVDDSLLGKSDPFYVVIE